MPSGEATSAVRFDATVYSQDTIKKAAYRFLASFVTEITRDADAWLCTLHFQTPLASDEQTRWIRELRAEVLDQDLRETIGRETAAVRNAVLALAFSRTDLQSSE
jgi:His-Xaa-Ser system protein HxsD